MFSMGANTVFACDVGAVKILFFWFTTSLKRIRLMITLLEILEIQYQAGGSLSIGGIRFPVHDTSPPSRKSRAGLLSAS